MVTLRTIEDSRRIAAGIAQASSVAVVGGGFIGLEIAAAARKAGKPVVMLEALDRLLARSSAPFVSDFFRDVHAAAGVDVRHGTQASAIEGKHGRAAAVITADGRAHQPISSWSASASCPTPSSRKASHRASAAS